MKTLAEEFSDLVEMPGGRKGIRRQLSVKVSVPADEPAVIDMKASDDTLDRYGETIQADGWVLDNYVRNPVIQNAHQYGDLIHTIGKAIITKVDGNALVQRWQFAVDVNPIAKIAYGMYRGGFLNASSVGFIPRTWENGTQDSGFTRNYTSQELLEVSAVGIPANPNALALAYKSGAIEKSDLREMHSLLKNLGMDQAPSDDDSSPQVVRGDIGGQSLLKLAREAARAVSRI
jgi:HK97 family phage prohead protease